MLDELATADFIDATAIPDREQVLSEFEHWSHDHSNAGKPLAAFLEESPEAQWFREQLSAGEAEPEWQELKGEVRQQAWDAYITDASNTWSAEKIESYNRLLDGKVLIPQPFNPTLRNFYERESGFAISKFMVIEGVVALLVAVLFIRLANRMRGGERPRGKLWNMFEAVLLYFRDVVVRPAIGGRMPTDSCPCCGPYFCSFWAVTWPG